MEKDMPTLYMLVGVPASGKSTWLAKNKSPDGVVVSSDNHIEAIAKKQGKTYNDVFKDAVKIASGKMNIDARMAFNAGLDVYWDQTNLNAKTRRGKLAMVPDNYRKVAVVFPTPDEEEHKRRLGSRPGKSIPDNIMQSMMGNFEYPTTAEGFDEVEIVK